MPNSRDFWENNCQLGWITPVPNRRNHPSAPNEQYGLLKRKHGRFAERKSLVFSMESDWRSGFECLLRHQGILQDNRFLLAFFWRTVFWKKKTRWYRYRGFKESLDIFLFFNGWAWIWGLLKKPSGIKEWKETAINSFFVHFAKDWS